MIPRIIIEDRSLRGPQGCKVSTMKLFANDGVTRKWIATGDRATMKAITTLSVTNLKSPVPKGND